jgi:hypothetical protein
MRSCKGTNRKFQSPEKGCQEEGPSEEEGCSQKEKEVIRP